MGELWARPLPLEHATTSSHVSGRALDRRRGLDKLSLQHYTYRTGMGGPWDSDVGWGCMFRCAQMLMSHALVRVTPVKDAAHYVALVNMFRDGEDPPYVEGQEQCLRPLRLHALCHMAASALHKAPGDWIGPASAAVLIEKALHQTWGKQAQRGGRGGGGTERRGETEGSGGGGVEEEDTMDSAAPMQASMSPPLPQGPGLPPLSLGDASRLLDTSEVTAPTPPIYCPQVLVSVDGLLSAPDVTEYLTSALASGSRQRGLLILLPRLLALPPHTSLSGVTDACKDDLLWLLRQPSSCGLLGGVGTRALFVVGCATSQDPFFRARLLALDPHTSNATVAVQQTQPGTHSRPAAAAAAATGHCAFASQCSVQSHKQLSQVPLNALNPSLCVALLFLTASEWHRFRAALANRRKGLGTKGALVEVVSYSTRRSPFSSTPISTAAATAATIDAAATATTATTAANDAADAAASYTDAAEGYCLL